MSEPKRTAFDVEHDSPADDVDEDDRCFWCGGDGSVETDDPLWDGFGAWVPCPSCGGSGAAKDMTIW